MIGIVLALAVAAIVVSLVGGWIFGIAIGCVSLILLVCFLAGFPRRGAANEARKP